MKPKPFMSLISVIFPLPNLAKWASISALDTAHVGSWLAADRRVQAVGQVELRQVCIQKNEEGQVVNSRVRQAYDLSGAELPTRSR